MQMTQRGWKKTPLFQLYIGLSCKKVCQVIKQTRHPGSQVKDINQDFTPFLPSQNETLNWWGWRYLQKGHSNKHPVTLFAICENVRNFKCWAALAFLVEITALLPSLLGDLSSLLHVSSPALPVKWLPNKARHKQQPSHHGATFYSHPVDSLNP